MARLGLTVEAYASWDALPQAAQALGGSDAFSCPAWYRSVEQAAMAPGCRARFDAVRRGPAVLGVFPMQETPGGLSALTTPYTVLWSPLLHPGLDRDDFVAIGLALGRVWRRAATTRLDALDADAPWLAPLLAGFRRSGLLPLRFDHFGNWHASIAGWTWAEYLAARPGALRSAIARRTRRLNTEGSVFNLTDSAHRLRETMLAYEQVYAASWKQPEPYPAFNSTLMQACAQDGSLRLGILMWRGSPIAAQFWLVHGGWAGVQKLAHDERWKHLAPGTVLTAMMIRHFIDCERVAELDFGRGDDAYKQSWTGERRQRVGVELAAVWHAAGFVLATRHLLGSLIKAVRAFGRD